MTRPRTPDQLTPDKEAIAQRAEARVLSARTRRPLADVGRTAGIFRHAAKHPPATIAEEKAAFEQAVADEVMASLNRS